MADSSQNLSPNTGGSTSNPNSGGVASLMQKPQTNNTATSSGTVSGQQTSPVVVSNAPGGNAAVASGQIANPASAPAPVQAKAVNAGASSPWDEDPPFTDGSPKAAPSVFGNLDKNPTEEEKPFNLPENLEEKVGMEKPAENYVASNRIDVGAQPVNNANQPPASNPVNATAPNEKSGPATTAGAPQPTPGQNAPQAAKQNKPGLFAALLRKSKAQNDPTKATTIPTPSANNSLPRPVGPQAEKKSFGKLFKIVGGVIAFLAIIVFLTEMGLLSIGAENFYGSFGIEKSWGGLSKDAQYSMARAALQMQAQTNYKITGTMALKVNKTTDSPVVSPLLSYGYDLEAKDNQLASKAVIRATKTSTDEYYVVGENSNDSTSLNENSNVSNGNLNDNSNAESNTNGWEVVNSNSTTGSEEPAENSNIVDVTSTLDAKVSSESVQADFSVKNSTTEDSLSLINQGEDLFVKNGSAIVFSKNDTEALWSLFELSTLKGEKIQQKIFDLSSDSSFSIKGSRVKNEKMNGERCYKYQLDSIELGDLLDSVGVESSMVQGMTGNVWIGVKSKLIRRISLNIVLSISSSVTNASVDLDFKDYGVSNKIEIPAESDYAKATPAKNTTTTHQETTGMETTKTPDQIRKEDIASMLAALKSYKADHGAYPISSSLLKLNTSGNMIEQALVPTYLDVLPGDPKAADGWYYAYKSDGKKCSISARLEDLSDPEGATIGGVFLYLKYNLE